MQHQSPSRQTSTRRTERGSDQALNRFRALIADCIVGLVPLPVVRSELSGFAAVSHEHAVSMLQYLQAAERNGLLREYDVRLLVAEINARVDVAGRGDEPVRYCRHPVTRSKLVADRFEFLSLAGTGGIGKVYQARDLRRVSARAPDPRVAIKLIRPEFRHNTAAIRTLQREAVNAQCLVHPGIRRVYELDRLGKRTFLVMEWLDGETLATRLDRTKGQQMSLAAFSRIWLQLTSALSYAHQHGVVHGDIKPGNLFLTTDSQFKLLDFGHTDRAMTDGNYEPFAITHGYSSPEVQGGGQPGIRDDLYSLSAMAYRMLAGVRPFGRRSAAEALALGLEPRRPSQLNRQQWQVLRAGLSFERAARPASVLELCNGLLLTAAADRRRPQLVVAA